MIDSSTGVVVEQSSYQGKNETIDNRNILIKSLCESLYWAFKDEHSRRQGQLRKSFNGLTGFVWDLGLYGPVELYRGQAYRHPCADSLYLWERWLLTRNALPRWFADRCAFACKCRDRLAQRMSEQRGREMVYVTQAARWLANKFHPSALTAPANK